MLLVLLISRGETLLLLQDCSLIINMSGHPLDIYCKFLSASAFSIATISLKRLLGCLSSTCYPFSNSSSSSTNIFHTTGTESAIVPHLKFSNSSLSPLKELSIILACLLINYMRCFLSINIIQQLIRLLDSYFNLS